jgi:lipopolysaccharide transport system ATP-binding protein
LSDLVITVESLSKEYVIGGVEQLYGTFREMLTDTLFAPIHRFRKLKGRAAEEERFWALKDVNLSIKRGEVVGIVGRNGAGKTTLLKILSRITSPTRGKVMLQGQVASLLEVGTGFHPELTGRENIFLNGAILGMTRKDILKKFDEIVAFAEVEKFLDTPVKRYSSGMHVRLAFSVAAHLDPDILLVDEVLAVGDVHFQKKCLGKMGDVSREGRTVLFVTHNLGAISKLCSKAVVLKQGELIANTNVIDALRIYTQQFNDREELTESDFFGNMKSRLHFSSITMNGRKSVEGLQIRPSDSITIKLRGEAKEDIPGYRTTVSIFKDGQRIISRHDTAEPEMLPRGEFESEVTIPSYFLSPGEYAMDFGGYSDVKREWIWSSQMMFAITGEWSKEYDTMANMGLVNLPDVGQRIHM